MHIVYKKITSLIHFHDDIPAFHIAYCVLTFVAAAMLSLGWFLVLICIHAVLDVFKYREVYKFTALQTARAVVHENLLDIALLLLALLISVFFESNADFLHVSGLIRAEISVIRFIGIVVPKYFLLDRFLKLIIHVHSYIESVLPSSVQAGFSLKEKLYISFVFCSVVLLVLAPYITQTSSAVIFSVVQNELRLWHL